MITTVATSDVRDVRKEVEVTVEETRAITASREVMAEVNKTLVRAGMDDRRADTAANKEDMGGETRMITVRAANRVGDLGVETKTITVLVDPRVVVDMEEGMPHRVETTEVVEVTMQMMRT